MTDDTQTVASGNPGWPGEEAILKPVVDWIVYLVEYAASRGELIRSYDDIDGRGGVPRELARLAVQSSDRLQWRGPLIVVRP